MVAKVIWEMREMRHTQAVHRPLQHRRWHALVQERGLGRCRSLDLVH